MTDEPAADSLPDRRSFLVRSAATLAAAPLLLASGCAPAAVAPAEQMRDFVLLSSALLGIAPAKLAPDADSVDQKSACFAAAAQHDARGLARMLQIYRAHASEAPATIADVVLTRSGSDVAFFAKSVMLAWLLGSWYDPALLQKAMSGGASGPIDAAVISANAYRESWAWKIGQSKAMGTSSQGFGYWSSEPPALSESIG